MLTVAHVAPASPSELWAAWSWNPIIWSGLAGAALVHHQGYRSIAAGRRRSARGHRVLFGLGLLSVAVALVSPLDALSTALASAHMVQHLMLIVVAAPLLVASAPLAPLIRGLPHPIRPSVRRLRRSRWAQMASRLTRQAAAMAAVHTFAVWFWHAGSPYDAALDSDVIHAMAHATLLATAVASWAAILHTGANVRTMGGAVVLVLFGLSVQSAILGALLTFAPRAWYGAYTDTTTAWGLTPLADQQLAGVIMWVPAGVVYLVVALCMLTSWTTNPAGLRRARHTTESRPGPRGVR